MKLAGLGTLSLLTRSTLGVHKRNCTENYQYHELNNKWFFTLLLTSLDSTRREVFGSQ